MKYFFVLMLILAAFLCGLLYGKYHVIYGAHVYAERDCILMDIDGEIHVYAD